MSTKVKRSRSRNILFSLILLFILFLLIEIIFSVYFYHRHSPHSLASIEAARSVKSLLRPAPNPVNVDNQNLVRPDSSEAINRQIAEETQQSNRFIYEPWIEFRNVDFAGKYVNIQQSVRRSVPDIAGTEGDTVDIYFFGGSTMFGFNVSDAETIPSQVARLAGENDTTGRVIRVTNFGTPTYYSAQELVLFTNLLRQGHKPDVVVFLDGVNDFWFARASYYNQSYFSPLFRQVLHPDRSGAGTLQLQDFSDQMYLTPQGVPEEQVNDKLLNNYYSAMNHARILAQQSGASCYFFCQPVPFYKYPRQQQDPICFKDTNTRFNTIYAAIENDSDSIPDFTFLGNMLETETGQPFVDGLHYSPAFNRKIAGVILQKIASGVKAR